MSISDKIKTIDNKTKQNKTQYNLDWETANISALSSENVGKYDVLTGIGVLPEKDLLEKVLKSKDLQIHHEVVSWKR